MIAPFLSCPHDRPNPAPKAETSAYRATLNMPDTAFPMRGDLPKREPPG